MAKKKLTQKQLSDLRAAYLEKRIEMLQAEVDELGVKLFDQVYENYLSQLEQVGGQVVYNGVNITLIAGLDKVYKNFRDKDNARLIKKFVIETQGLTPINEQYFAGVQNKPTYSAAKKAIKVVNKGLGVTEAGVPVKNGFVDKFIRDDSLLKKIKKQTTQALTQQKGFQQFREELKVTIQGEKGKPLSGGLHQYYRNNAWDTMHKVDRINSEVFADDLGMHWFYWSGGQLPTSRNLCVKANGKLVNSAEFQHLKYKDLKPMYRDGLPNGKTQPAWKPLEDLGGFGCNHRKDYIATEVALRHKDEWLDLQSLKK
jgi:hypothetical protein